MSEFEELLGNLNLPNVTASSNAKLTSKGIGYTNDLDSALKLTLREADALEINLDAFTLILETSAIGMLKIPKGLPFDCFLV